MLLTTTLTTTTSTTTMTTSTAMRWCWWCAIVVALAVGAEGCGPGRGAGRRRGPRKLTPLVFKQHVPNVSENTLTASGLTEGRIGRDDKRFRDLVPNYNEDIIFKDEEGTGADRLMTQRCKEKLNTLAISVMNQWPGVRLRVTEGWDEEGHHATDSLHYEGRAVDITTSDRDRSKYGMLARLAVEAGFDWVYYESRAHIHCSVKSESSQAAKYGGCFTGESSVTLESGETKRMSELMIGERVMAVERSTGRTVFSEVMLFLDRSPQERRQFLQFELASGKRLTVTPAHLVLTVRSNVTVTVYADTLQIGSELLVSEDHDGSDLLVKDAVVGVQQVGGIGVYAPLTTAGTVVVDGVAASCYATIDDAGLAHWVFAPLRFVNNWKNGALHIWKTISRPFQRSSTTATTIPTTVGVHWYARILYFFGDHLIPSHMHK